MTALLVIHATVIALALLGLSMPVRVVQQNGEGVLFRLGRVVSAKEPGLALTERQTSTGRMSS